MEKVLRIGLAQINPTVGDLKGNAEKIFSFFEQAEKLKVDIVTFPELAVCGYPPEDLLLKKHFVDDNLKALASIGKKVSMTVAVVGFVDRDEEGNLYNAAGVFQNGNLRAVYHKVELPNYGVFDEKRYFQPGREVPIFKFGNILFGVNICEDIWKAGGIAKTQADKGARLILNISASPYHAEKGDLRRKMLEKRAKETGACLCVTNLVGGQDELVFDGESLVIGRNGRVISHGKQFKEDLIAVDIPLTELESKAQGVDSVKLKPGRVVSKPLLDRIEFRRESKTGEIYNALVLGTGDYVKKNGFKKVVVALSGGIDSALTAVIACDAVGGNNVIGVYMPSRYSSRAGGTDVRRLARNMGIRLIVSPIDEIFSMYLSVLRKEFHGRKMDVTEENIQARIRCNLLMALSNKFRWLVLTTGNKSEISVGYCTLYGDMAGGFAVIKDVSKTLVYELATYRNRKGEKKIIPPGIFRREPSAELREGQKDRDSLPAYEELDEILKGYVEKDMGFEQIVASTGFDPKIIRDVIKMVDGSEYKRRQAPPGTRITPKAFGKDRRLPISNAYSGY